MLVLSKSSRVFVDPCCIMLTITAFGNLDCKQRNTSAAYPFPPRHTVLLVYLPHRTFLFSTEHRSADSHHQPKRLHHSKSSTGHSTPTFLFINHSKPGHKMAAPAAAPKRHRGNKLGERRGKGDAASSRDASEEGRSNPSRRIWIIC
jgi:hypothetical protein